MSISYRSSSGSDTIFGKVWQHPYLDLFRSIGIYNGAAASNEKNDKNSGETKENSAPPKQKQNKSFKLVGNVEELLDSTLGKKVFSLKGSISANNCLNIPNNSAQPLAFNMKQTVLGLTGKYAYIQLKTVPNTFFTIHIDILTAGNHTIRCSFSNLYKSLKVINNGISILIPILFLNNTNKWTVLAIHWPTLLAEAQAAYELERKTSKFSDRNSLANHTLPGPTAYDFQQIQKIQICSTLLIRTIITSTQRYSIASLPRDLRFPVLGKHQWDDVYQWFWLGNPPTEKEPTTPLNSNYLSQQQHSVKSLTNEEINASMASNSVPVASYIGKHPNFAETDRNKDNLDQTNTSLRSSRPSTAQTASNRGKTGPFGAKGEPTSHNSMQPDPILKLHKIIGYTPRISHNLTWNPEGDSLVYSCNNEIIFSNVATGEQKFLHGHTNTVNLLVFNNTGALLASGQEGKLGLIRIWDYASKTTISWLQSGYSELKSIAFNVNSTLLAAVGRDSAHRTLISIWDISQITQTGKAIVIAKQTSEYSIAKIIFSPFYNDAEALISVGHENIRFWSIKSKHLNGSSLLLNQHARNSFTDLAFEGPYNDGNHDLQRRMFVSTASGSLFQINYAERVLECVYKLHNAAINTISINQGFCVTGSSDNFIRVWPLDFSDFYLQAQHKGEIYSVAISPDGLNVAVASSNACIGVLDLSSTAYQTRIRSHLDCIYSVAFDPHRDEFATVSKDGTIRIWGLHTLEQIYEFFSPKEAVLCVDYCPRTTEYRLACGFSSGSMRIMDISSTSMHVDYQQHSGRVLEVKFNHQGTLLFSAGADYNICCYDVDRNYLPIKMFTNHKQAPVALNSANLLPYTSARPNLPVNSQYLQHNYTPAAERAENERIADKQHAVAHSLSSKSLSTLDSPIPPHGLAISADDSLLATIGSDPNTVILLETSTLRPLRSFNSVSSPVASIQFNSHAPELVLVLLDQSFQRYNLASGDLISHTKSLPNLKIQQERSNSESSLLLLNNRALNSCVSPLNNYLAVATAEPGIKIYDFYGSNNKNSVYQQFNAHGLVSKVANSNVTASNQRDLNLAQQAAQQQQGVYSLQYNNDGRYLISVGGDSIWIWAVQAPDNVIHNRNTVFVSENAAKQAETEEEAEEEDDESEN
jgi:WD40 repeat protein